MVNVEYLVADSRKIHLIEEMLKVNNNSTLTKLEDVLSAKKNKLKKQNNIYDFLGIMNKKEVAEMQKAINKTCEKINSDDWK